MKYIGKYLCEEILLTSECICLNDYTIGGLYCQNNCYFYDIIYKICENIDIALYMYMFYGIYYFLQYKLYLFVCFHFTLDNLENRRKI